MRKFALTLGIVALLMMAATPTLAIGTWPTPERPQATDPVAIDTVPLPDFPIPLWLLRLMLGRF